MRGNARARALGRRRRSRGAEAVFVGSEHIRAVLEEVVGHVDRVHEVPPGVDVDEFVPEEPRDGARSVGRRGRADPPTRRRERAPSPTRTTRSGSPRSSRRTSPRPSSTSASCSTTRASRSSFDAMRDLDAARGHRRLRRLPGSARGTRAPAGALHRSRSSTVTSSPAPARRRRRSCPSIFPEAFGMVAAEAAAAGVPPLVAGHSGLAEVAAGVAAEYPERTARLASFRERRCVDARRQAARAPRFPPRSEPCSVLAARRSPSTAGAGERGGRPPRPSSPSGCSPSPTSAPSGRSRPFGDG